MSRGKGTRKPCDVRQARLRLVDARQFLEAAELLDAPDVRDPRRDRSGGRGHLSRARRTVE